MLGTCLSKDFNSSQQFEYNNYKKGDLLEGQIMQEPASVMEPVLLTGTARGTSHVFPFYLYII